MQKQIFSKKAVEEISRIEALLSTYQSTSETNLINENAGIKPVKVSDETFSIIARSKKISEITQGALILLTALLISVFGILIPK